jgi:fatty acid amide hydrolase 2
MSDPLLLASATSIARQIRAGTLSSRHAVEVHIAQMERVNPALNAVVKDRFSVARAEADQADALRASGAELPLFHGVPCTVKECFALAGMPNASGLVRRKHVVATEDATAVGRMRRAGLIPLGVTNTSELCMWMETNNYLYGRTNNPYNVGRIVGGSSGGEGAIVASGASPVGIGSDIGGSIRMPAFFNGVFGHKPTGGLVPGTGQYPMADRGAARYLATGPLCRRAEDLMPLLRLMAGPDGQDPGTMDFELGEPSSVEWAGRTVVSIEGTSAQRVSKELIAAQRRVAAHFVGLGARVEGVVIPELKAAFDMWSACLQVSNETPFGTMLGQGTPISPVGELSRWAVGRSQHTAMASLLALTEPLVDWAPAYRDRMVDLRDTVRNKLLAHMGSDGILLFPSYTRVAPKHHRPFLRQLLLRFDYAYTAVLNVMEFPVTQVPLGLNHIGLPLGVQVAAPRGQDHLTIAAALELERAFGGWVPPKVWLDWPVG